MLANFCDVNQLKLKKCKLKDIYNTNCRKYNVTILEQKKKSKKMWSLIYEELSKFINSKIGKEYLSNLINKYDKVTYLGDVIVLSCIFEDDTKKTTDNLFEQFKNNFKIGLDKYKKKQICKLNNIIFELKSKLLIVENSKMTIYNLKKIEILKKRINSIKSKFLYKILKDDSSEVITTKDKIKNNLYCEYLYMSSIIDKQETLYNDLRYF